jgi:hypothetical protein
VSRVRVCGGFDGSDSDDWTALRLETVDGWQFTPTYGPSRRPTIWNPAEWGGRIPRGEVHAAMDEVMRVYEVERLYADPRDWVSEIEAWALAYGEKRVLQWATNRITQMHEALRRFETDLITGSLTHDGCPITAAHIANMRKLAKPGDRFIVGKPSQGQKIDAGVSSVICHEAAADARAAGWAQPVDRRVVVFR